MRSTWKKSADLKKYISAGSGDSDLYQLCWDMEQIIVVVKVCIFWKGKWFQSITDIVFWGCQKDCSHLSKYVAIATEYLQKKSWFSFRSMEIHFIICHKLYASLKASELHIVVKKETWVFRTNYFNQSLIGCVILYLRLYPKRGILYPTFPMFVWPWNEF